MDHVHVIGSAIPTEITSEYEISDTLGTGHFSKVKLGVHKQTGEKVAIKIIQKPTGSKIAMLKAEVDILTRCDHPNVVKMHACYETEKILYLVLELLTGGELFDCIIAKGHYSEADARGLTVTLLDAIKYLHLQGIAHRDLKPENILLKDSSTSAAGTGWNVVGYLTSRHGSALTQFQPRSENHGFRTVQNFC